MDIKVSKSAHACAECERDFVHEEELSSRVRIIEGALLREDFCGQCWTNEHKIAAYSVWTPKYYDPKVAEQEPPEVFSPMRQLFYEAVDADERLDLARAFLAAQLLRRQKVFRLIKESDGVDGEAQVLLYADRIGDRLIEVRDPNFSYAELDSARAALIERLQELEAPEKEAAEDEDGGEGPGQEAADGGTDSGDEHPVDEAGDDSDKDEDEGGEDEELDDEDDEEESDEDFDDDEDEDEFDDEDKDGFDDDEDDLE